MALDTIVGKLRAYKELEPDTFQHADQLMDERRVNPVTSAENLRNQWFYTADGNGYFVNGDDVDWAITREAHNLVLRHLDDKVGSSYDQLVQKGNYRPNNDEALTAKNAADTVVIKMGELRLSGTEKEWRYLQIRTKNGFVDTERGYQAPNSEEEKAMTRLGYTADNLKMLKDAGIKDTKIYVLNPECVREEVAKDPEHDSLWRGSWLDNFNSGSYFDADDRDINNRSRLRGVRRVVAVGDAEKIEDVSKEITPALCYETLLANPDSAVTAMDDNVAAGLSEILARYLSSKTQNYS